MPAVADIHAALRQSVAPCDRVRRQFQRRQRRAEATHDVHRDGLRGVEDVLDRGEVEREVRAGSEAAKQQCVGEVGSLEVRSAVLRRQLQPEERRENERQRREVDAAAAAIEQRKHGADESHVVVLGQPAGHDGGAVGAERAENDADVGDEGGDGDHHALGERCGPRRVLEEAEMVAWEVQSRLVCVR